MKKKLLAMGLGALLVAGSVAPAFAASQVDFSGYYRTYFGNTWNNTFAKQNDDSSFAHRLNLDFVFKPTDEISVNWEFRAPNSYRWGAAAGAGNTAESRFVYGQIDQDWGSIFIGRFAEKFTYLGLHNLGYQPKGVNPHYTLIGPFDVDAPTDGIRYLNRWDSGFQLAVQYNRLSDAVGNDPSTQLFTVEPAFFWDGGAASLGVAYLREYRNTASTYTTVNTNFKGFTLNPAFVQSFGDFSIHFEGKGMWLKDYGVADTKAQGLGFYLDFDYNYGPGNAMLAGWWISGDDDSADKNKGALDFGTGFKPLLIAYGGTSTALANGGAYGGRVAGINPISIANGNGYNTANVTDMSNHWAIAGMGNHAFTDDVTMHYALAYLALNKVAPGQSKGIGWEADLGFTFKLLDNLDLRTTFGYFGAGKAVEENVTGDYKKSAYSWVNTLQFSF